MAEVSIVIKGRQYDIACDDGQEDRVLKLAAYIDNKLKLIARSGSAYNESHLMVLTSLVLADEVFEIKEKNYNNSFSEVNSYRSHENTNMGGDGNFQQKNTASAQVVELTEDKETIKIIKKITKRVEDLTSKLREAS